jgi:hypothetical protein
VAELRIFDIPGAAGQGRRVEVTWRDGRAASRIAVAEFGDPSDAIYGRAGNTRQALRHCQQAIQHHEAWGNIYEAGLSRYNIALLLAGDGQISDALHYAHAALHNFEQAGPGAASSAADTERLIAELEQRNR